MDYNMYFWLNEGIFTDILMKASIKEFESETPHSKGSQDVKGSHFYKISSSAILINPLCYNPSGCQRHN